MGLDWLVEAKPLAGREADIQKRKEEVERLHDVFDAKWNGFLRGKEEKPPGYYPNPLMDEFRETDEIKNLLVEIHAAKSLYDECFISPEETLGLPRVGYDEDADSFVRNIWETHEEIREAHPTIETYLQSCHGQYVLGDLQSDGVGSMRGFSVPPTSFRGKTLNYCEDVLSQEIIDRAYSSMSAEALEAYGNELEEAVQKASSTTSKRQIQIVTDAAKWAKFWGSRGHSLYTWY